MTTEKIKPLIRLTCDVEGWRCRHWTGRLEVDLSGRCGGLLWQHWGPCGGYTACSHIHQGPAVIGHCLLEGPEPVEHLRQPEKAWSQPAQLKEERRNVPRGGRVLSPWWDAEKQR